MNLERGAMFDFLNARFDMPPTDRIAQAFIEPLSKLVRDYAIF